MKKLDNIVVEKPKNEKEYKKILKIFKKLGYRSENMNCESGYDWFIGIVNNMFDGYRESHVIKNGVKIITLEQLKAMKEDKSEYPKLMWVSDNNYNRCKRTVIGFFNNSYWALNNHNNMTATRWKYAQDIEEAPGPKQEEKTKVEFTGTLCMGDFQENTMTFEIEGDMTLQAGRYLISKID